MERAYIAWTVENWITVVLMVTLGWLLWAVVWQVFHAWRGGKMAGAGNGGQPPGFSLGLPAWANAA